MNKVQAFMRARYLLTECCIFPYRTQNEQLYFFTRSSHTWNYLNLPYLTLLSHPSPSAARLPVDEPALASIMTHDHAKDLSASKLGPLRI